MLSKSVARWITKEEKEIAKRNGISKSTLHSRVTYKGWDVERAITEPPKKTALIDGYREQCEKNGISSALFINRIRSGMSKEEAAKTPPQSRGRGNKGCKVEGCKSKHRAKGFCSTHYYKTKYKGWKG
jgi:hypothetical protein